MNRVAVVVSIIVIAVAALWVAGVLVPRLQDALITRWASRPGELASDFVTAAAYLLSLGGALIACLWIAGVDLSYRG